MVVIGHSYTAFPGHCLMHIPQGTPAVSVFFFLSGYGLMRSVMRDREGYLNGFLPRSCIKLGVPLLMATIACCLFLLALDGEIRLLERYWKLLTRGEGFPHHSWFVYALFAHYVGFALAFGKGSIRRGLVIFGCFSLGYYLFVRFGLGWRSVWWRTSLSLVLGMVWAYREDAIRTFVLRWRGWIYAFATVFLVFCTWFHRIPKQTYPWAEDVRFLMLLAIGPATVLVMYALRGLPRSVFATFAFLGGISYEIYLLHFIWERGLVKLFPSPGPYYAVVIVLTVLIAWIAHRIDAGITRRLQKWYSPR